jgi:hypothetical protein
MSKPTRTIPACQLRAGELAGLPNKGRHSRVNWEVLDLVSSVGLTVIRSQYDGETRTVRGDYQMVPRVNREFGKLTTKQKHSLRRVGGGR